MTNVGGASYALPASICLVSPKLSLPLKLGKLSCLRNDLLSTLLHRCRSRVPCRDGQARSSSLVQELGWRSISRAG